jgi:hypothetical protein
MPREENQMGRVWPFFREGWKSAAIVMLNVLVKHLVNASKAFSFADDLANEADLYAPARFLTNTFGMTAFGTDEIFPKQRAYPICLRHVRLASTFHPALTQSR